MHPNVCTLSFTSKCAAFGQAVALEGESRAGTYLLLHDTVHVIWALSRNNVIWIGTPHKGSSGTCVHEANVGRGWGGAGRTPLTFLPQDADGHHDDGRRRVQTSGRRRLLQRRHRRAILARVVGVGAGEQTPASRRRSPSSPSGPRAGGGGGGARGPVQGRSGGGRDRGGGGGGGRVHSVVNLCCNGKLWKRCAKY